MIKRIGFVILIALVYSSTLFAQEWELMEIELKKQFDATRIDSLPVNVFAANDTFIRSLTEFLNYENSFQYPLSELEAVSIQYPQDSSFRIFSWQVNRDSDVRYYGAIQMNQPNLLLFPLKQTESPIDPDLEFGTFTAEDWLGGVIYKIHSFEHEDKMAHLVFGYIQTSPFKKIKYIDVLHFEAEEPVFGMPVFVKGEESVSHPREKFRHIMPYASTARVRLNYDSDLEKILFDHITPFKHPLTGEDANIPDGTYEAYELVNGKWQHIEKVFNVIMDEAPRPVPVLDKEKRDILGRETKN